MAATRDMLDRVERTCRAEVGAKTLRLRLLDDVRRAIPFDGYVFPLTDPTTRVGTAPLADVPGLEWPQLPNVIRWRYLTRLNRWDALTGAASLQGSTGGDPTQSPMWQNALRKFGVTDTAALPVTDRYGSWGFLELWRTTPHPFTRAELASLTDIAAPVATGLRAAVARTFAQPAEALSRLGPAVVILTPDLQVRSQTAVASEALFRLNPPDEPMSPIPAAAYNIGAALVAYEHDVPVGPPWSRVNLGGSRWITLRADRLGDDIAVSIEASTPAERLDLFARSHGFSAREAEVLTMLGAGNDTRTIAATLVISEHTATDHVKALLAKSGARTRQALLARALGS